MAKAWSGGLINAPPLATCGEQNFYRGELIDFGALCHGIGDGVGSSRAQWGLEAIFAGLGNGAGGIAKCSRSAWKGLDMVAGRLVLGGRRGD